MQLSNSNEKKSIRSAYGKTLVELGKANKDIVVLDADLSCSTQTCMFAKEFPERFFNVGIAEQDMMATSAGLAIAGKIPFASTFAMFAAGRAWEQIRNSICYPNLNVKIVATHGGITVGEDGASHQALEDIAIMRTIPNMKVIIPCDCVETKAVIEYAAKHKGPMYIRLARTNVQDIFVEGDYTFSLEKAVKIKNGKDLTIITNGETLIETINAAKLLEEKGINAGIIHMPVVKPIDAEAVVAAAKSTGFVVSVENHSVVGGLGGAIAEVLSEQYPTKLYRIGTNDEFGQSGEQRALMEHYGLTAEKIAQKVAEKMAEKLK